MCEEIYQSTNNAAPTHIHMYFEINLQMRSDKGQVNLSQTINISFSIDELHINGQYIQHKDALPTQDEAKQLV
jgi:hypothetical protein